MANKDPSPSNRFKPGKSGNPGGKPAPKPQTSPEPSAKASPTERPATPGSNKELAVARLPGLIASLDEKVAVAACKLAVDPRVWGAAETIDLETVSLRMQAMYGGLHEGEASLEAEQRKPPRNGLKEMTDGRPVGSAVFDRLGSEDDAAGVGDQVATMAHQASGVGAQAAQVADQAEERKPAPRPCGLKELSPADQAFLAARRVDDERLRREQVKHPNQVAPAPPPVKVEPEPDEPVKLTREDIEVMETVRLMAGWS